MEGVPEVHEKCIAAPPETVLDIGVRESCSVEEIGRCYADRVARPHFQVWVMRWHVEGLVGDVPEEGCDFP